MNDTVREAVKNAKSVDDLEKVVMQYLDELSDEEIAEALAELKK